jgi:NAD(P)H-hydrate epimerase
MMHPLESKVLDINSEALGIPAGQLMENAGRAVAEAVQSGFPSGKILVVCGGGNNGGDGAVAARYLAEAQRDVSLALVVPLENSGSALLRENMGKLPDSVKVIQEPTPAIVTEFSVIVDAMIGIGLRSEPREPYASWIESIGHSKARVISVDVPSGFGTGQAIVPAMTVTFHDSKEGMNSENCGKVLIADIGIPPQAAEYTGPGEFVHYPFPAKDSHKGQNGRLLIIGGGAYTGAPALAAFASQAIGVDLVTIATPESCASVIASYSPNFIVRALEGKALAPGHMKMLQELCKESETVLIGPGLGREEGTVQAVREFLTGLKIPVVVDADGLFAMSGEKMPAFTVPAALTPHAREFTRLGGSKQLTPEAVDAVAKKYHATVLLKQPVDIISDGGRHKLNRTGNPKITVGGTGDVLAGVVAGLMAKGVSPFDAARMGAYLNGAAGDMAFGRVGQSMTATDVIACMPGVLERCLRRT